MTETATYTDPDGGTVIHCSTIPAARSPSHLASSPCTTWVHGSRVTPSMREGSASWSNPSTPSARSRATAGGHPRSVRTTAGSEASRERAQRRSVCQWWHP